MYGVLGDRIGVKPVLVVGLLVQAAVIAAYLMLYPRVRVWGLAFKWIPVHVPAVYTLGGWILCQAASAWFDPQGNIGWWAHLGGLATGAALTPLFIRRGVGLFGRRTAGP